MLNTDETTAAYAVLAHDPIPVTLWYEATRRVGEDKRRVRTLTGGTVVRPSVLPGQDVVGVP